MKRTNNVVFYDLEKEARDRSMATELREREDEMLAEVRQMREGVQSLCSLMMGIRISGGIQ